MEKPINLDLFLFFILFCRKERDSEKNYKSVFMLHFMRKIEAEANFDRVLSIITGYHIYISRKRKKHLIHKRFDVSESCPYTISWNNDGRVCEIARIEHETSSNLTEVYLLDKSSKEHGAIEGQNILEDLLDWIKRQD